MKKYALIITCLLSLNAAKAQMPKVVHFDEIQKILSSKNDTTYVLNFWATWCVPCVKEFPAFQALGAKHKGEKVQLVMVSMDFPKEIDKTLKPYIVKHPIDANVYLLNEPDYNAWINKVDTTWDGAIPVTLIINGNRSIHAFYQQDFTPESLEQTFNQIIKTKQ